jgi:hypothetical protein
MRAVTRPIDFLSFPLVVEKRGSAEQHAPKRQLKLLEVEAGVVGIEQPRVGEPQLLCSQLFEPDTPELSQPSGFARYCLKVFFFSVQNKVLCKRVTHAAPNPANFPSTVLVLVDILGKVKRQH